MTFTVTTTGREFLDEITNLTHSGPGSGGLLTLKNFELGDLAIDLRAARSPQPAARYICLVGLWAPSGEGRQPLSKAHVSVHSEEILRELLQHLGLKKGSGARRDRTHVDLHSLQHALRQ